MPAMSAVGSAAARPWVAEDLDGIPDDGYRREIIDGVLHVSPSPVGGHQRAVLELAVKLRAAAPDHLSVMISPYDWRPPTRESLQPDLMVIRERDYDPDGWQRATPVLVVEMLSPSSIQYDGALKRAAYQRLGVPAYWIVDPAGPAVTVLRLDAEGRYQEAVGVHGDQALIVDFPFPTRFTPADLL